MRAVPIRAMAGTSPNGLLNFIFTVCTVFPLKLFTDTNFNQGCSLCASLSDPPFTYVIDCADGDVALHSSCGHNRVAFFQDCNSALPPIGDLAGTYLSHGWWIDETECAGGLSDTCSWKGPYSPYGKSVFDAHYHTNAVSHGDTRKVAIEEFRYAPAPLVVP